MFFLYASHAGVGVGVGGVSNLSLQKLSTCKILIDVNFVNTTITYGNSSRSHLCTIYIEFYRIISLLQLSIEAHPCILEEVCALYPTVILQTTNKNVGGNPIP